MEKQHSQVDKSSIEFIVALDLVWMYFHIFCRL
jgi:hypothetical protein